MLIYAALFSCVDPILSIAAYLSAQDIFRCSEDEKVFEIKRQFGWRSDHQVVAHLLNQFESLSTRAEAVAFCKKYYVSLKTLDFISKTKKVYARYLFDLKFLKSADPKDEFANKNSENDVLLKSILCCALYPNVATIR